MLVNLREVLRDTREKGYAVGLFNCVTLEMAKGILMAAEALSSPVIIGPAQILLPPASLEDYADLMLGMARRAKVPVCLHFDHGFDTSLVRRAIELGYTSVMYDGSMRPIEENIQTTREMVALAHQAGCSVEAEIGHVGSNDRSVGAQVADSVYTLPEDARDFADATGCDALAVAIGTAHGVYETPPVLSFDALRRIRDLCATPLVLHGGSGLSDDDFRACVAGGISKMNIFTANNLAAARAAQESFTPKTGAFELMEPVEQAVMRETMRHIRLFGSEGKA